VKRPILWILVLLILVPLLLAGFTILASRLINLDAIKNRIETAVSRELGGQIQYERVGLTILPRPQVVISRLAVTIPGSVVGTSESLKVAFELLPLLTGNVRLADVRIGEPRITVSLGNEPTTPGPAGAPSSGRSLPAVLGWLAATMPNLAISIDHGQVIVARGQERVFALQDGDIQLAFSPMEKPPEDASTTESAQPFRITGRARVVLDSSPLPQPIRLDIGGFDAGPGSMAFSKVHVQALDAEGTLSGRFNDYLTTRPTADFTATGSIGPKAMQRVYAVAALPETLLPRTPLSIASTHLVWTAEGAATIAGSASLKPAVSIAFKVQRTPEQLLIDELNVRDQESQAAFTMSLKKRVLGLSFRGHLAHSTLGRIFEQQQHVEFGSLKGDLRVQFVLDRPRDSSAQGRLEGDRLVLPVKTRVPVFIDRIAAQATNQTVSVDPLIFTVGGAQHTVRGQITASTDQWLLDLTADDINWATIGDLFRSDATDSEPPPSAEPSPPTRATIRVAATSFTLGRWTSAPARAEIVLGPQPLRITVQQAVVCGIALAGSVMIEGDMIQVALTPSASRQDLEPTLACLAGKPLGMTGTFDLSGRLSTKGTSTTLLDDLNGTVALSVKGGRFHADSAVVKIFSYLNLTDLLRGSFPDPGAEGVPYKSLVMRGTAKHGRLLIDEAVLASSAAQMAARGSLDLGKQTFDITVLVAPLTSVDAVVKKIPLIRDILGGSLMTIPVRVTGPFDQPKVDAVPPGAVAEELGGIMERTLKLPFKIMAPIIPGKKESAGPKGGSAAGAE